MRWRVGIEDGIDLCGDQCMQDTLTQTLFADGNDLFLQGGMAPLAPGSATALCPFKPP